MNKDCPVELAAKEAFKQTLRMMASGYVNEVHETKLAEADEPVVDEVMSIMFTAANELKNELKENFEDEIEDCDGEGECDVCDGCEG